MEVTDGNNICVKSPDQGENYHAGKDVIKSTFTSNYTHLKKLRTKNSELKYFSPTEEFLRDQVFKRLLFSVSIRLETKKRLTKLMICYLYWLMNILNTSWLCNKTSKLFSGCIVILIICFASFLTVSFQLLMIKETQWPSQIFLLFFLSSPALI